MTVVLLICVVPPREEPFVMIAADSRASGEASVIISNRAKKIFDAGNAYISISGWAYDDFREELARILIEQPGSTIEEKMQTLYKMLSEDKRDYSLKMNVGLVQLDKEGNPQMGLYGVNSEREDVVLGPYIYDKSIPIVENIYFGVQRTDEFNRLRKELNDRLISGEINKTSVENAVKWFIRKVAIIYPETVNSVIQTETLSFK